MKRKLLIVALGIFFLIAPAALAGEAYVGASVGQTQIKFSAETDAPGTFINFDEGDNGFKIFGGYRFLKFFGLEGSYVDMGSPDEDQDAPAGTNLKVDVTAWDAYAVGVLPIGKVFEVFGKAGFIWWDADFDLSGTLSASDSDSGSDPAYGAGVAFRLGKRIAIRGEYEKFDLKDTDNVSLTSVGIDFRF
jgi:OOP family OmpA-OmpF porin